MESRDLIDLGDLYLDRPTSYQHTLVTFRRALTRQLRKLRTQADLSQAQLADYCTQLAESNVSFDEDENSDMPSDPYHWSHGRITQPYIAMIEANRGDPKLSKVLWIMWCLELRIKENQHEMYCKTRMTGWRQILWARPDQPVRDVIDEMGKMQISQVPVVDRLPSSGMVHMAQVLGILTDEDLFAVTDRLDTATVKDVMRYEIPAVEVSCGRARLKDRLRDSPAVLVLDGRNRVVGIITKADMLKSG